ncbi:nucleoside-diphosphate sugar epimerase/dehydratase [uncultured Pontibacter sp.]|uniref:polysaccharide biosynthesis protein n=1 Tax=uncultured Pontibacter sp. TaxID=453356 RepID=UPI002624B606|nr:nucleoside-diphosphate sugar epimerase/dehydratase [uncultured Pontibacter sp.]
MKIFLLNKSLPKNLILLADQVITTWAFIFSYFIIAHFDFPQMLRGHFFIHIGIYAVLSLCTFYAMRIHTGLIRYSSTQDVVRIFSGVLTSSVIYASIIGFILEPVYHISSVNVYEVLLVNFFISSSILVLLRIGIKNLFFYFKRNTTDKKERVLIYGANGYSILVKHALETSGMGRYVIAGFVDDNPNKVDKDIQQKRVYHIDDIEKVQQRCKVDKLVVMSEDLRSETKKQIIERCVELGIKVMTVPPAEQWMSGQLKANQIKDLKIEDLLQRPPIVIENAGISADVRGKRILITGAAGSIGSEIVRQVLAYNPASVVIFDQAESPLHELQLEVEEKYPNANIVVSIGNIQNFNRMYTLFKEQTPDIVYHAAAYKHVPMMENNPSEAILTNVLGTKNLADLSMTFDVEKFVMISTDKAVNPTNIMGASKRIAEIYIQSLNNVGTEKLQRVSASGERLPQTKFITTRFGNVLGSNGSVIPRFSAQIERGVPITVTHPDITRYFMTIPEAVQLVLEAGTMGKGGEIFIFDMGEPVKIVDLAKKMIKLAGLTPGVDIDIVFTGLRPGEKLYEELLNEEETTIPTHHNKIKISKVRKYAYNQVVNDINELISLNKNSEDYFAVKKMKQIVPEFLSKNSRYEELDDIKHTA